MSFSTIQKGDLLQELIKLSQQMRLVAHDIRTVYGVDNDNADELKLASEQVNLWAQDLIMEIHDG